VHVSAAWEVSPRAGESGNASTALYYRPVLRFALNHRLLTVSLAALLFVGSIFLATGIGKEFMPPLNEGDLMYMPVTDPAISIDQARDILSKQDAVLKSFPKLVCRRQGGPRRYLH